MSREPVSGVDFDALFDRDLLYPKNEDAIELPEKRLNATREVVEEVAVLYLFPRRVTLIWFTSWPTR